MGGRSRATPRTTSRIPPGKSVALCAVKPAGTAVARSSPAGGVRRRSMMAATCSTRRVGSFATAGLLTSSRVEASRYHRTTGVLRPPAVWKLEPTTRDRISARIRTSAPPSWDRRLPLILPCLLRIVICEPFSDCRWSSFRLYYITQNGYPWPDNASVFRYKDGVVELAFVYAQPTLWSVLFSAWAGLLSARTKGAENGRTTVGFLAAPARHLQQTTRAPDVRDVVQECNDAA